MARHQRPKSMLRVFDVLIEKLRLFFLWLSQFVLPKRLFYKDIRGESILITGAGSGIGRLLAIKLAARGAHMVLVDINRNGIEETKQLVNRQGASARAYVCDISNRQEVYELAKKIKQQNGFISMVINNAGIVGNGKRFLDMDDEKVVKTIEVNALAHVWMMKNFLPEMKIHNHGHIVTIASYAGLCGAPSLTDYCASKYAAVGIAECLSVELWADGYDGIKSTIICPFIITTGLFEGAGVPLIPNLSAERAAEDIVQAILTNQSNIVILPKILWLPVFIKTLLPWSFALFVCNILSGQKLMDKFVGRNHTPHSNQEKRVLNNNEAHLIK